MTGAWWPDPPLSEHLLHPDRSPFLIPLSSHLRRCGRPVENVGSNNGSLLNVCYVFTIVLNMGAKSGQLGNCRCGET